MRKTAPLSTMELPWACSDRRPDQPCRPNEMAIWLPLGVGPLGPTGPTGPTGPMGEMGPREAAKPAAAGFLAPGAGGPEPYKPRSTTLAT